ncbi:hypothetical protein HMPREF9440_00371 [Sutterella parvirubra YIT 11816]|uniref:Uncharacterized protein n=1 Tax=Sutterella parvirubra YIT 11816 TaxID=762967 RepID=H3KCC1_9BURK|nr:hypothetical protein HMPREF9440_00371 [Sutterella parvirubra YIT 11816]
MIGARSSVRYAGLTDPGERGVKRKNARPPAEGIFGRNAR